MPISQNTLFLVVAILLILFVLFSKDIKKMYNCAKQSEGFRNIKEKLEDATQAVQQTVKQTTQQVKSPPEESAGDEMQSANSNHWIYNDGAQRYNTSGLKGQSDGVNSALSMDVDGQTKYSVQYDDIIKGEIGRDTLESQQQYRKYVHSDNSLRYIDKQIEGTSLVPWTGLSLSRLTRPPVQVTNSTQNLGQTDDDLAVNQGGVLRNFVSKDVI